MAGGSFPFSSSVSRHTPTGQARLVLNVGLVPEVTASSCSLKCLCKEDGNKARYGMDGLDLRDGSTSSGGGGSRCEASSWGRFSELDGFQVLTHCCDPYPSSSTAAGDQLVLNRPKSSVSGTLMMDAFNATCNSNCASPCISWNGQNFHTLSAYMDASCTTANLNLLPDVCPPDPKGQRASYGTHVTTNPSFQPTSHEFKPDDASSHNNNNNIMFSERSGDLEAALATENDPDLEVEELAGLSESINDSLLQEDRVDREKKARGEQVVKGSKRKAAEALKNPSGAEVQSEERTVRNQNESRIVRVSRLTGGKDRHSKVRTSRGLRDRRVRLSVPTAIQFYDLQDRLGLEQPSMAVDWLLNNAKAAIDNLPPIADASNTTEINTSYSNCSPVKSGVESPKDVATATATDAQKTAHEVGIKNGWKVVTKAVHEKVPMGTSKDSSVGRSSSSTSDGSIMGTEYSSKSARLKDARERAKKKARNSAASSQLPITPNMLQSCMKSRLMNVTSHGSVPQESWCGKNGILYGTSTIQQLWDYDMQDISCQEHFQQFQSISSTLTASLQQQQQSSQEMQSLLPTSSPPNFDMENFTTAFIDPKQRNVSGNAAQIYLNSLMDHQPQAMQKHFGSTFVPTISNGVNFTTSDHSSRGPLQSNSTCITTATSSLEKNTLADATVKENMFPLLGYDPRIPEKFQTYFLDGNAKYQLNH